MVLQRRLGTSDLLVSEIGLGCMGLSFAYGQALAKSEATALIHKAIDLGVTFFDTAQIYGDNEIVVGEALKSHSKKVIVATKCGIKMVDQKQVLDARPEVIQKSAEESLKRLQIETIDLYYLHRVDTNVPIENVAETMKGLQKQGKISHWGLSEASVTTIRRAHSIFPLTVVQSEYSLMWTQPEKDLFPTLEELGIGLVPFSPLGKAFLTGTVSKDKTFESTDFRSVVPRFTKENIEANQGLVEFISNLAKIKNAINGQIALAWLLGKKPWIVPIPGTKNMHHLKENIDSSLLNLSPKEISNIDSALEKIVISGDRYQPGSDAANRVGK
jgi:aryl-alcohol dehydrogenase-like predicted oxidoreductase